MGASRMATDGPAVDGVGVRPGSGGWRGSGVAVVGGQGVGAAAAVDGQCRPGGGGGRWMPLKAPESSTLNVSVPLPPLIVTAVPTGVPLNIVGVADAAAVDPSQPVNAQEVDRAARAADGSRAVRARHEGVASGVCGSTIL